MILRNITSVLHGAPLIPRLLLVFISHRMPDLLTPDDVFELKCVAVTHDPFGDFFTRERGDLCSVSIFSCVRVCIIQVSSIYIFRTQTRNRIEYDKGENPRKRKGDNLHHRHQNTSYPSPIHSNDPNYRDTHNLSRTQSPSLSPETQQQSSWHPPPNSSYTLPGSESWVPCSLRTQWLYCCSTSFGWVQGRAGSG